MSCLKITIRTVIVSCMVICVIALFRGSNGCGEVGADLVDKSWLTSVADDLSVKDVENGESLHSQAAVAHEENKLSDIRDLLPSDDTLKLAIDSHGALQGYRCSATGMDVCTVAFIKWLENEYLRRIKNGARSVRIVVFFDAKCSCADRFAVLAIIAPMFRFNVRTMNTISNGRYLVTELSVEWRNSRKYSSVDEYLGDVMDWKRKAETGASSVVATLDDGVMFRRSILDVCAKSDVTQFSNIVREALGNPDADLSISWRCAGIKYLELIMGVYENDGDESVMGNYWNGSPSRPQ